MSDRPYFVKCVYAGPPPSVVTWCGRQANPGEFSFSRLEDALMPSSHGARLELCPKCSATIAKALQNATWDPKSDGSPRHGY